MANPRVDFRVTPEGKRRLEDLAWEARTTVSALVRSKVAELIPADVAIDPNLTPGSHADGIHGEPG